MASEIKITFLGTSDSVPTAKRNHTSILLSYKSENILVDCGEGTQRQFRKAGLNPCKINKLLITHWHGDHVLGIPGLLQTLALSGYNKALEIYGPKGTKQFIRKILDLFKFHREFEIKVKEVSGKFYEEKDFYLESTKMNHGIECNAYNFIEKGELRIDKKKLKKSELPEGPLISELKNKKNIKYKGKTYKWKDYTFQEPDRKISFVLDTAYHKKITDFVNKADLFICESAFSEELFEKAKEYKHLTSKQAAEIAKNAKVKSLVLTHISQRYSKNSEKILHEAKKKFDNTRLANDFDEFLIE